MAFGQRLCHALETADYAAKREINRLVRYGFLLV
jgi:hypothetical protein